MRCVGPGKDVIELTLNGYSGDEQLATCESIDEGYDYRFEHHIF